MAERQIHHSTLELFNLPKEISDWMDELAKKYGIEHRRFRHNPIDVAIEVFTKSGGDLIETIKAFAASLIHFLQDLASSSIKTAKKQAQTMLGNIWDLIIHGASMLAEDIFDFGKTDRIHHWILGLVLLVIGAILFILALLT